MRLVIQFCFVLYAYVIGTQASAEAIVWHNGGDVAVDLSQQIEYYLDKERHLDQLSIQDAQLVWESIAEGKSFSIRHFSGALWLRFSLENPLQDAQALIINHSYPHSDLLDLYLVPSGQSQPTLHLQTGDRMIEGKTGYVAKSHAFKVKFPPGQSSVYLRIVSQGIMSTKLKLWDLDVFVAQEFQEMVYLSWQLGGIMILAFYNIFLYVSLRLRVYIYYIAYLLAFFTSQLILTGLAGYILPEHWLKVWLLNEGLHITIKLTSGFACYFTYHFLNLRIYAPKIGRILVWAARLMILSVALTQWGSYRFDSLLILPSVITVCVVMLAFGVHASLRGYRPAYFYTLAWTFLLVATILYVLKTYGYLPVNLFTTWVLITGGTIESVLLSFALGEHFNDLQKRIDHQREGYIQELINKEKAKKHSYEQMEKMIYPHQLVMIKNGLTLEDTMPTGSGLAFVISFDTVGSTRLERAFVRPFLSEVFHKCNEQMLKGYHQESRQAQAFRIKEMGDGFLCSIGYPFQVPDQRSPADVAMELAISFSKAFSDAAKNYEFRQRPVCSLALTFGEVESFYSQAGVIEYSMYGRGIVLADRYEGLRKVLFSKDLKENFLVIQHEVYQQLDATYQQQLKFYSLKDSDIIVRDDSDAQCFYYGFICDGRLLSKRIEDYQNAG
ncbi:MAG: 7TM diverse intracellular signaling domain-containing protein [Oligoflexus sp.]